MTTGWTAASRLTLIVVLMLALGSLAACTSTAENQETANQDAEQPAAQEQSGESTGNGYPGNKLPTSDAAEPESGYPDDESADDQTGLVPLDADTCADLADSMAAELGVEVATADADFADYITGEGGTGCDTTASGTGVDFESYVAVADSLKAILAADGWAEDMNYAADGPTGTATALNKDSALCLLSVNWAPSDDADCPEDQPISACELEPEQQLYSIELNCAQAPPS